MVVHVTTLTNLMYPVYGVYCCISQLKYYSHLLILFPVLRVVMVLMVPLVTQAPRVEQVRLDPEEESELLDQLVLE